MAEDNPQNWLQVECTVSFVPPNIKKIIVRDGVTVIIWSDGTKTRSTCSQEDKFDPVIGLAQCLLKRVYGKRKIASMVKKIEYQRAKPKAKTTPF